MDAEPLSHFAKMLLTAGSRVTNTGLKWNDAHTRTTNQGESPSLIEPVTGTVVLRDIRAAKAGQCVRARWRGPPHRRAHPSEEDGGGLGASDWRSGDHTVRSLGNPANWDDFADFIKAGIAGVQARTADGRRPRIMIHIDKGGDAAKTKWFFDKLNSYGVKYDLIGQSYYPWWHGSLNDLRENEQRCVLRGGAHESHAAIGPHLRHRRSPRLNPGYDSVFVAVFAPYGLASLVPS